MIWHWFLHFTGSDNVSGPWYGFFSGFGSDLGEIVLLGALWSILRKHNCAVHHCWRVGRHKVPGTEHICCRRHAPGGAPTHEDVIEAHAAAQRARRPRRTDPRATGERLQSAEASDAAAEQVHAENSAAEIADAQPKTRRPRKPATRKGTAK